MRQLEASRILRLGSRERIRNSAVRETLVNKSGSPSGEKREQVYGRQQDALPWLSLLSFRCWRSSSLVLASLPPVKRGAAERSLSRSSIDPNVSVAKTPARCTRRRITVASL